MNLTRKILLILLGMVLTVLAVSCNRGEGPGGTGAIEGTVYKVLHPDDNYNLETDTVLAAKEDVFLVYGTQSFYGDDEETDHTGFYERYGWEFLCMVQGNDEDELSRMYIHR